MIASSCTGPGTELETTVDQTLIRGLVTAFRVFVSGLSAVSRTGVGQLLGHITSDGSSPPRLRPRPCATGEWRSGLHGCHLAADRPQEGGHFASDGGDHDRQLLAGTA